MDEGHQKIISPVTTLPPDAKVKTLIHGNPPAWDSNKIKALFLPYDAEAILKIPISARAPPDKLIWHATRDGNFSVRSGYHLLLQDCLASNPGCSSHEPDPLWKSIWAARVPAKVKTFLWRACHDSLPTKSGLYRRKVVPHPYCENCSNQMEDEIHALWSCSIVSSVWNSIPDFSEFHQTNHHSFCNLVRHILKVGFDLLFEKFGVTSWLLWHKHNQNQLHLPNEDYTSIWPRAQAFLQEYILAIQVEELEKQRQAPAKWKPPVFNSYKANFDGAFSKNSSVGGIGVVIRDKQGMVIATLSQKVQACHSAKMIEALAAKRAIHFAIEVGLTDVEFEGMLRLSFVT